MAEIEEGEEVREVHKTFTELGVVEPICEGIQFHLLYLFFSFCLIEFFFFFFKISKKKNKKNY